MTQQFKPFLAATIGLLACSLPIHSSRAQPAFANNGFETPVNTGNNVIASATLNSGAYDAGWNFGQTGTGNGSVLANNSAYGNSDGSQVLLLQQSGFASQNVGFALSGVYNLQFLAAQRSGQSQTIGVSVDGTQVATVVPAGTTFASATATTGSLALNLTAGTHSIRLSGNVTTGDNSAFVDNVTLLPSVATPTIAITNPSFETYLSGSNVGYGTPAGWTATGGTGTNRVASPQNQYFDNNGIGPDGGEVAFIQGTGSLSQTLSGFVIGNTYQLSFFDDTRASYANVNPIVSLGSSTIYSATNVGPIEAEGTHASNFRFITSSFVYTSAMAGGSTTAALTISSSTVGGGDGALDIDDVQIVQTATAAPEPGAMGLLGLGILPMGMGVLRRRKR